jgi:amidase
MFFQRNVRALVQLATFFSMRVSRVQSPNPQADLERANGLVARALEMINNTCPFDASGHPAISVPCGMVEGLPVGMMLVGRQFDEVSVLRASDAFERGCDWKSL